jgi:hypothetical protein
VGTGVGSAYDAPVDVRIGVTYSPKELTLDLDDTTDVDGLRSEVEAAVGNDKGVLWFTDRRGRTVGIPADKISYVEIGTSDEHRIGFGA